MKSGNYALSIFTTIGSRVHIPEPIQVKFSNSFQTHAPETVKTGNFWNIFAPCRQIPPPITMKF